MTKIITASTVLFSAFLAACATEEGSLPVIPEQVDYSIDLPQMTSTLLADDFFSNRDYRTTIDSDSPVTITFSGDSITADGEGVVIEGSTVTITTEGSYILTGTLDDGEVVVNMTDETHKAQLVLDQVSIHSSTSAAIHIPVADKVFITTTEGSENFLSSVIDNEESVDGTIFARCDLTLNGLGSLDLQVENGDGIVAKDELTITSGTYSVTGDGNGMDANDGISIADGTFHIQVEKDGFHAEHSSNESKGNIYIQNGTFYVNVQRDGFDAGGYLEIVDGYFDITTNGGWESAPVKVAASNNGMMGGMTRPNTTTGGQTGVDDTFLRPEMTEGDFSQQYTDRNEMRPEQDTSMNQQGQQDPNMNQDGQQDPNMNQEGQQDPNMSQQDPNMNQQGQQDPNMSQQGQTQQGGMMSQFLPEGLELPEDFDPSTMTPEMMMEFIATLDPSIVEQLEEMMGQHGQMGGNYVVDGSEEDLEAPSTKGLKSQGELRLYGGTFVLDCYDDAIHSDTWVEIHDGSYEIGTADDAIHSNWDTIITGGDINIVSCFEGIEGQRIVIAGGLIDMYCGDDGINAASANIDPDDKTVSLTITGGKIIMDTNSEGDGLDSNGSILITGGDILISSTTDQRDTSLDSQYDSIIYGGSFIATGSSSGTIQNFDEGSTQCSILSVLSSVQSGQVTLKDSSGKVLVDFLPVKEYQAVAISIPELEIGETYTLVAGNHTETITMDSLQYGSGGRTNTSSNRGQR